MHVCWESVSWQADWKLRADQSYCKATRDINISFPSNDHKKEVQSHLPGGFVFSVSLLLKHTFASFLSVDTVEAASVKWWFAMLQLEEFPNSQKRVKKKNLIKNLLYSNVTLHFLCGVPDAFIHLFVSTFLQKHI